MSFGERDRLILAYRYMRACDTVARGGREMAKDEEGGLVVAAEEQAAWDGFAGAALPAVMIRHPSERWLTAEHRAEWAQEAGLMADALLIERRKRAAPTCAPAEGVSSNQPFVEPCRATDDGSVEEQVLFAPGLGGR